MASDICLILEGSYPYVAGGVSTWVAQLLGHMREHSFSLLCLGAKRDAGRSPRYKIPPNVVELQEYFLFESPDREGVEPPPWPLTRDETAALGRFAEGLGRGECRDLPQVCEALKHFETREELFMALSHARESWRMVERLYEALAPRGLPFLDFFWTFRSIVIPAICVLREPIPRARIYHAASTGYAGLLGAKAVYTTGAPLLLTEHGLYARERRIEIFNASWIQDSALSQHLDMQRTGGFFKEWWNAFFRALSRAGYQAASHVICLHEADRQLQIEDGAPAEKTEVIPNGIRTEAFQEIPLRERRPQEPLQIGYIGRIATIKDIKGLLRALAMLKGRGVAFECVLLGPMDEEPEYATECQQLAVSLGLGGMVRFLGQVDIKRHLPELDVVVLTSTREGMPFVVLEANCAGRPVVSTDVGSCRDLLLGRLPKDKALGPSGLLAPVGSAVGIAAALEQLALHPDLARQMGAAGRRRVLKFYNVDEVMRRYEAAYAL